MYDVWHDSKEARRESSLPLEKKRENCKKQKEMLTKPKDPSRDDFFQYGTDVIGPLLFGFCKWLHKKTSSQNLRHLFFLSRDGYLLFDAYKELYPADKLTTSYLYISRKAVREAQLWLNPDLYEVSRLFPERTYLKREEFCKYFNVEGSEAEHIWVDCGLPLDMHFLPKDIPNDRRMTDFYERMKPCIIEQSKQSYSKIVQYLQQNQFCGRVGIVDIGWRGTIQKCLETIFQNDRKSRTVIVGFYLGLTQEAAQMKNRFSFIAAEEKPYEFVAGLVEYPFLAPEGSLLGYSEGPDGYITTELANCEYDKEELEIVKNMQAGALHFINYAKDFPPEEFTWDAPFSYANLKRFSKHPTLQEVNTFGDLAYYDGEKRQLAAPRSFTHYLFHPKDFPYDLSVSGWRIGFLKRFFKVGLDYNKLLKLYKNAHGS